MRIYVSSPNNFIKVKSDLKKEKAAFRSEDQIMAGEKMVLRVLSCLLRVSGTLNCSFAFYYENISLP